MLVQSPKPFPQCYWIKTAGISHKLWTQDVQIARFFKKFVVKRKKHWTKMSILFSIPFLSVSLPALHMPLIPSQTSKWKCLPARLHWVVIHCHITGSWFTFILLNHIETVNILTWETLQSWNAVTVSKKDSNLVFFVFFFFPKTLQWDTVLVEC